MEILLKGDGIEARWTFQHGGTFELEGQVVEERVLEGLA